MKKSKKVVKEPQVMAEEPQVVVDEPQVVKQPTFKEVKSPQTPKWEIKDRLYELNIQRIPPVYIMKSKNLFYFDEEKGYEREIKYCRNQQTVFVDEMKGPQRLGHIIFRNGKLYVDKEQSILQKFLSIYHPEVNKTYTEFNAEAVAQVDVDILELQLEAMNQAKTLDIDRIEAIMRTEVGNRVTKMTSKELKRDVMLFAQENPELFLELVSDESINIRNIGIKSVEQNIVKLSSDNRTFTWASNGRKLLTVPFDENPYSALAAWFKTDDGIEVYQVIEKKLK
tara:strand:+ start:102 stop:947 length:846 start_codon:yes stop_codon:yes gene_type:complete